ncbi:hypothetical protein EVAR_45051_1 [Eumeta japonica]|uniref:Uncharacterized protein n=1 Tax=Eumeta variegata TaxID=151549 RepID=A0A4C1ZF15_EUMVA|nr:hypothetical protein EVAR_45051_1 [Eumeta japonica]
MIVLERYYRRNRSAQEAVLLKVSLILLAISTSKKVLRKSKIRREHLKETVKGLTRVIRKNKMWNANLFPQSKRYYVVPLKHLIAGPYEYVLRALCSRTHVRYCDMRHLPTTPGGIPKNEFYAAGDDRTNLMRRTQD